MTFAITAEQEELRSVVRQFLNRKSPSSEIRRLMETEDGLDPALWTQMAEELGLQGLAIPEENGGSGAGALELAIVFEEMGRALLVAPFFSCVALAAPLLLELSDQEATGAWLEQIADGSLTATVATTEPDGDWGNVAGATTASPSGDAWLLDGVKTFVLDGHTAGLLLVSATTPDGLGIFAVTADADGLSRTPLEALDLTRKMARIELSSVRATRIGTGDATAALARVFDLADTLLAAEQAGGASRCLDEAVDYAKIREQFGKPIGSFQAIKHKCADMLMEVESARSAAYYAAWTADEEPSEFRRAAAVAQAYCADAYLHVASENIQIHGGIGVTWEHDAHLYFRRAKSSQLMFGDSDSHRERLADLVGI